MPSDTSITVDKNLDWKAGDEVVIAPTALQYWHSDAVKLTNYDAATGVATLEKGV